MSKSAVRYFVRKVSAIKIAKGPRYRIRVKKPCVDVDSWELLALEASYGRSSLKTYHSSLKHLRMCTNKPLVIVDKGPWYRWAFESMRGSV